MSKIIPLNNELHSNLKVTTSTDYSRFKDQNLIPVIAQDFLTISTEFPIIFVKNSETNEFISVAMMGIKSGINLYCQDKNWPASVAPAAFSNAPLSLTKPSPDSDDVMICFDEESPLISKDTGEALFNITGEQSEYLNQRAKMLVNIAEATMQTQSIVQYLAQKQLLITKKLTVKLANEASPFVINGAYIIDEAALNKLPTEEFVDLRKKGLLPLIYAHLTSLHQITRLATKQNSFDKSKG
jgi:hypothetical protein